MTRGPKWVCGHNAVGMCSRCHSVLAWKAHLLVEVCDAAILEVENANPGAAPALRRALSEAINYHGET